MLSEHKFLSVWRRISLLTQKWHVKLCHVTHSRQAFHHCREQKNVLQQALLHCGVQKSVCVVCYSLQLIAVLVMTHPCQPTPVSLKRTFQTCYLGSCNSSVPFGHICSMSQGPSLLCLVLCGVHPTRGKADTGLCMVTAARCSSFSASASFFFLASIWFCECLA